MSKEYPFEIPERLEKHLAQSVGAALPPWYGLEVPQLGSHWPEFMNQAYAWHKQTAPLMDQISEVVTEIASLDKRESIHAQISAIQLRFKQLEALLTWYTTAWEYDPAIRAVHEQPTDPTPEKEPKVVPLNPAS